MKKILVPVDFNPLSSAALEYAARLAARTGAELIVIYADTFDPPAEFTAMQTEALVASIAESRRRTAEELERYAHEHVPETMAMRTELREALPVAAILAAIEQHQPDLVVMGTHGRGALARLLLGSGERHQQGMISSSGAGASVLSIEFVRISAGEISGKIAPYDDPEVAGATLETHFTGRPDGDWIEGTFVTYSDHGVSPRRGTWRVHRKPVI